MKAVITGAAGFVGTHLRSHLWAMGDDVVGFDLTTGPDLRDGGGWCRAMADAAPDAVYHLAGWSDVGGSWDHPVETFEINATGTVHVLEACRQAGVESVLVVSSADVYGIVDAGDLPLTEERPPRPRSPYGASKVAAEVAATQYWHGFGLGTIVVRPFNHLGPGQSQRFAGPAFAGQVAALESTGGGVLRHGDLTPRRDITDVRDVVRAYRLLVETCRRQGTYGQIFQVCSGQDVSMQSVLDRLRSMALSPIDTAVDPALLRPVDLPVLRGSNRRLRELTGWEPEIDLDITLGDVLDDARSRVTT